MVAPKGNKFWLGRHHTEESKRKISKAKRGKKLGPRGPNKNPLSKETRKRMSIAHMGEKNHFYGRKHTEETKRKISIANTGHTSILKGRTPSKETRNKMSQNHANVSGENNPAWKGGKRQGSYIYIYSPEHPYNNQGYVQEHRLIMEKILNRFLNPEETVHHKDNDRYDNSATNLLLFPTNGSHVSFHWWLKGVDNIDTRNDLFNKWSG